MTVVTTTRTYRNGDLHTEVEDHATPQLLGPPQTLRTITRTFDDGELVGAVEVERKAVLFGGPVPTRTTTSSYTNGELTREVEVEHTSGRCTMPNCGGQRTITRDYEDSELVREVEVDNDRSAGCVWCKPATLTYYHTISSPVDGVRRSFL
jgi:hypothetical protein